MALTFDEAVDIAYREASELWKNNRGTLQIDDRNITEDDNVFIVRGGAREFLVDGDRSYLGYGGGLGVVEKTSGRLTCVPWHLLQQAHPNLRSRPNPNPRYFLS
jgi:hypothetical protein